MSLVSLAAKFNLKVGPEDVMANGTPGERTLVSRATDANGIVQPTAEGLSRKKTFLEDNSQHPRKVMIA